ncbi:MAG TPA: MFS transporter [Pyrinomonadaceae bacterium]|nr:MFS transporter [Pyrinomonadaceae bacterium]
MEELQNQNPEPAPPGSLLGRYRKLPRNVVAIGFVSLLNDASSEIIYPLLPIFLSSVLGASASAIGVIEGAAESISSLLKLFAGYFSDRVGKRKPLVVAGYALANLVRPFLAVAGNWYQVLAIRLTDRVGKGIRTAPRDALIADTVAIEQRGLAFGFHRAMDHTGAVIGPLLGYFLVFWFAADRSAPSAHDFTRIFLWASVPGVLAVIVGVLFLKEYQLKLSSADKTRAGLSWRGFDGNFKRFLVVIALFTLSNSSDAFLLLRAQDAGVSVVMIPLLWAALHASKVLSSLLGGDLSDRLGRKRVIIAGWLLYAGVYAGFAFVGNALAVWILFLIYGLYFGLTEGVEKALVADLVRPEQRGTAFGLYNLAFSITVLPASILMGQIWDWKGPAAAFLVSAALGTTAALMMMLMVRAKPDNT